MLLEKLIRLECSLHGDMRKDRGWLEQLLHKEFREITRTGVLVTRTETIESLSAEINTPTILSSDFQLISVSDNFAILHYRTFNPDGSRTSLRSSCWQRFDNDQWKLVFHQGTPKSKES